MLIIFLILIVLVPILAVIGLGITDIIAPRLNIRTGDRIIVACWLALFALGNLLTVAAIATPLTPVCGVTILFLLFFFSLIRRNVRTQISIIIKILSIKTLFLFLFLALIISFFSSIPSENIDTGAYHFQYAKWLSQFGIVKGVGLVIYPVAIATSWLPLTAPFNHGFIENRCHGIIQGILFFIFTAHLLIVLSRFIANKYKRGDVFLLFCWLISWPITGLIAEMSVNTAVTFAIITAGFLIIVFYAHDEADKKDISHTCKDRLIIAFCFGAASLKITALPLPFALILWILYAGRIKSVFQIKLFLLASLFLAPNAVYSTLTSGYPFFISSVIKFDLAWTLTGEEVRHIADMVHSYYACHHSNSCGMSLIERSLAWAIDSKDCLYLILLNLILFVRIYFCQSKDKSLLWFLGTLGVLVSFFIVNKGPSLTYSLGWLSLFPASTIALRKEKPSKEAVLLILAVLLIPRMAATKYNLIVFIFYKIFLTLLFFTNLRFSIPIFINRVFIPYRFLGLSLIFLTIGRGFDITIKTYPEIKNRIFIPEQVFNIKGCDYQKILVSDFELWKVGQNPSEELCECWSQELPCSGVHAFSEGVQLLNPALGIAGGFKREKN